MKNLIIWIVFQLIILPFQLYGQKTVQVVTKSTTKSEFTKPGDTLHIVAEKADITIENWSENAVQVEIKLISKHQKVEVAKEELSYLIFELNKNDGIIEAKNYFKPNGQFKSVKGILKVEYRIKLPGYVIISLQNKFGSSTIEDLQNTLHLNTQFVEVDIINCNKLQSVASNYGSLNISNSSGNSKISLQKVKTVITRFNGSLEINANYSDISLEDSFQKGLSVEGERTSIDLLITSPEDYSYDLNTEYSKVVIPNVIFPKQDNETLYQWVPNRNSPSIKVKTTYQPINIKLHYNASKKY